MELEAINEAAFVPLLNKSTFCIVTSQMSGNKGAMVQQNAIVINEGGLVVSSLSPIVTKSHPQVNNQLQVFGATNQVMSNIGFSTNYQDHHR